MFFIIALYHYSSLLALGSTGLGVQGTRSVHRAAELDIFWHVGLKYQYLI